MEGSHFASSSPAQQEDSWTCQRCGWVYPNAHPSAKHRRNHKKHCGKVKGFELHSEDHKGGSSDEASSDDGNHVNKESLSLQSQHDSIGPVEAGDVVHVVEPPRELQPPETNDSNIKSAAPVHISSDSIEFKPEVPAYESTRNVNLTDIVKSESSADGHVPNIGPCDKTTQIPGDGMNAKSKDTAGNLTEIAASDIPDVQSYMGLVSGLQGIDAAAPGRFPHQINHVVEGDSMHQNAAPDSAGSVALLDEPSRTIEGEGGVHLPSRAVEAEKSNQSKNIEKVELTTTPAQHPINHQGSSQEDDSWTCRRCGWVYPNPHPSAKHRRNHKKHCGKLKGFEVQTDLHKGGSSDEVSSDEDKKGHTQHESSPLIQSENLAGGLTLIGATTSSEDQSRDLCASKESPSAGGLQDGPDFISVKTGTEPSYIDPRDAVFLAEEHLEGQQGKGVAAEGHTLKVPHDSNGPEIFQRKEEMSSSQAIAAQTQSSAIPSFAVSEGLSNLVKDFSGDFGSTPKVSNAPCELKGESNPNFENSSVLNILPSDDVPPADVGSSKAEYNEIGAVVMPITHPRDRGLANENLEPFGGTGSHKDVHANETTDEAGKLDSLKRSSLAGEMPDREFSSNSQPVMVAGKAPDEEAENLAVEGSSVQKPLGALSTAAITGSGNHFKVVDVQTAASDAVEHLAKDEVSGHTFGGREETSLEKIEAPQETELLVQSLEDWTSAGKTVSEMRTIPADISGEMASINDTPTARAFSSESKVVPESMPLVSVEDTAATCSKDEVLGQTDGGLEVTSTSGKKTVVERPKVTEMPTQSLDNPGVDVLEERPIAHTTGELLSSDDRPTSTTFEEAVVERPQVTEMPTQSLDNPVVDVLEEKPIAHTTGELSRDDRPTSTTFESMSEAIPEKGPPALAGKTQEDTLPTSAKDEILDQTDEGLEETSTSSMDKVVERPQWTEMPTQLLDNPGVDVSEERPIAHTTGELLSCDDRLTSTTIESNAEAIPERGPPALIGETQEDTLSTSTKEEVLGQTDRGLEETSTSTMDKVGSIAHTTGEMLSIDDRPSSTTFESKAEAILERGPPAFVGGTQAMSAKGELSGQTDGVPEETSNSTMDRVVERPKLTEIPRQALNNPGVDVSEEGPKAHTTEELLSSDDRPTSTTIESKSEPIPESRPPALVGDTLATTTIANVANGSGLSSSPNEGDSKKSSLVKGSVEDKSPEVRAPLEVLDKPDSKCNISYEADFGSSGRSLEGTNSFINAESEFSQRSDFAASSHKLSDSLEIFEDAPDSLEVCSVGGSVEESESLDEPRQVGDGAQEDSKLLRRALDERTGGVQNPNVMNGASNEPEQKPSAMNAGEASSEEKAITMPAGTSAIPRKMDELKAPSPEAWQEPRPSTSAGPSTSAKEGKKIIISEVMEDGKSSESHTALRSLMSMEGKDKLDETVAIPLVATDLQISGAA
ncbi:hypothetical protein GOP47_0004122 [Adiantum capillus-veneris]|uniref:C2H2-type domain-containing protein n=1 Tax=Adiantum capillus-veneris TaxID=13818 RepID=A0A9D4V6Z8_ADICA|nr:hypothetical protein GOP47_0004122 [Adiantum capillus-veneris]